MSISSLTGAVASAIGSSVGSAVGSALSSALGGASNASALTGSGINIAKISNARIFLNGGSLVGMAETVTGLGCPKPKFDEFKALGLLSSINLFSSFEQPEVKIKWTSIYRELAQYLFDPLHAQRFQLRASQEVYKSGGLIGSLPLVANFTGFITENSDPSIEQGSAASQETTIKVISADMTINSQKIYEYDVMANIYKVGGSDIFKNIFANMGV